MPILPKVLAVVTLPVLLSGCIDPIRTAQYLSKPKVEFANTTAWNCDAETKVPNPWRTIETCHRCINKGAGAERVTINGAASEVAPGGAVLWCPSSATIMAFTAPVKSL